MKKVRKTPKQGPPSGKSQKVVGLASVAASLACAIGSVVAGHSSEIQPYAEWLIMFATALLKMRS
jgi:hypothetical protein